MARIGIFRDGIYPSGGIETWLYNIAVRWGKTHDITIFFDNADEVQLKRLQRLEFFNEGKYRDSANSIAITHLEQALQALKDRQLERSHRGVEGEHKV